MRSLNGVIVPVATPLGVDESPDFEGLGRLVEFLLASGVHGLFANGSMGGFAFHTGADQAAIVRAVVELAAGRCPVLAGVSDTGVARVIARMRALEELPLAALVVLPPYYFVYAQDELERFFLAVAEASIRPIVLYENPRLAHNSLEPETIARLSAHPNIIGVKHSSGDTAAWERLFSLPLPRERFALICGAEKRMAEGLRAGFDGLTGGFHNIVPNLAVQMFRAAQQGDWTACFAVQEKLNRAYRVFELAGGWRGLEIAFQWMGIARKATVRPFDKPAAETVRREIESILEAEQIPRPYHVPPELPTRRETPDGTRSPGSQPAQPIDR